MSEDIQLKKPADLEHTDKDLVDKYFSNADVVLHLAGITSVPRTKNESS